MVKLRYALFVTFALASLALTAFGQDVVIDWGATPKKLVSFPAEVSKAISARVVVNHVNDILYTYTIEVTGVPRSPGDDLRQLFPNFGVTTLPEGASVADCGGLIKKVNEQRQLISTQIANILSSPDKDKDGKFKSIPLKDTIAAMGEPISAFNNTLDKLATQLENLPDSDCLNDEMKKNRKDALTAFRELKANINKLVERMHSDHQITQVTTLAPDNDYKVTITESYTPLDKEGKPKPADKKATEDGKQEFTFSPVSYILTLSGGVLLSSIEQRSYLSRKDPVSGNNVLAVDGTGFARPIGVALLNYQIPGARWYKNTIGLNLSSGLVVDLGTTKSDVSRLGWFGGVSLDFYHRLFITPGFHFGEFADFPVGLGGGSPIPANFGELNPVKRYTGHFAIAITYRTTSLIKAPGESKPATEKDTAQKKEAAAKKKEEEVKKREEAVKKREEAAKKKEEEAKKIK